MVEQGNQGSIDEQWVKENLGLEDVCTIGSEDLEIVWLPEGTAFQVNEYDGAESITTLEYLTLIA